MSDQPQGTGSPTQEPQGSAAPEAVSIDEKINKAITARFKAFEKQFESKIGAGFETFGKSLDEKLAALAPKQPEEAATPKSQSIEEHPSYKGLQKRMRELEARAEKAEQDRQAELSRNRDQSLRQKLADQLASSGVDAARIKHASAWLVDASKSVRYSEDGESIVFRDADGGEVDLATGVKSWTKSDDGKLYMPPRGVSGSGDRPVHGQPKQQGQPLSDHEIGLMILQHANQAPIL